MGVFVDKGLLKRLEHVEGGLILNKEIKGLHVV